MEFATIISKMIMVCLMSAVEKPLFNHHVVIHDYDISTALSVYFFYEASINCKIQRTITKLYYVEYNSEF